MADIGHGTTIVFTTSGFTGELRGVSGFAFDLGSVDASHAGTTYAVREYIPGMLDPGEVTFEIAFDPDELSASGHEPFADRYMVNGWSDAAGVSELISITWPTPYDATSGAIYQGQGFIKGISIDAPLDDLMTATITVQRTGAWTFTAAT